MSDRAKRVKLLGPLYVLGGVSYFIFNYFVFVTQSVLGKLPLDIKSILLLGVFHVIFFMFLWSFFSTSLGDPGRVPGYWRFDNDPNRMRKPCQICQLGKPERCHHCSICNTCVLNMDHHCPWVHNCIGFKNRKFFMLMLFYLTLTLFTISLGTAPALYTIVTNIIDGEGIEIPKDFLIVVSFISVTILFFGMLKFGYKHIAFVRQNTTTLEELDQERGTTLINFNIGADKNWQQVFGANGGFLCFLPIWTEEHQPLGDGIIWERSNEPRVVAPVEQTKNKPQAPAYQQVNGVTPGGAPQQNPARPSQAPQQPPPHMIGGTNYPSNFNYSPFQ